MKIAMVAPVWIPLPPPRTGPIQRLISLLTDGLVADGHDVTLFAPGGSSSSARLVATRPDAPLDQFSEVVGSVIPELDHAVVAYDEIASSDIDLVHDHTMAGPALAAARGIAVIHTVHRLLTDESRRLFARLRSDIALIAISDHQRRTARDLQFLRTIHNAVDVASTPFRIEKDDFALFIGRLNPYKGADRAIAVARRLGVRLVLIGRVVEPIERSFFEDCVKPLLGPDAVYLGEASGAERDELVAHARMVLFPASWPEPFGLVLVEAAAAGTPVIALRVGAIPEVVEHGLSGFVVDTLDEMVDAGKRISEISPENCRALAFDRFDVSRMVGAYVDAYGEFVGRDTDARIGQ